jgi:hypothetical protein
MCDEGRKYLSRKFLTDWKRWRNKGSYPGQ